MTLQTARIQLVGISMPRAGHHYLVKLLSATLGSEFYHCEYYTPLGCCRSIPCTRGQDARVVFQKNHDFGLAVPPDLPGVTYVIQHRVPLLAALSDREYLARLEGQTRADDEDELVVWLGRKAAYVRRFWDKWLRPAGAGRIVIDYDALLAHPVDVLTSMFDRLGIPVDRARLDDVVARASTHVADFPPAIAETPRFAPRTLEASRYFDGPLFAVFESVVVTGVPELEAVRQLPAVATEGHPIALICDAELSLARHDAHAAAVYLTQAAAALPANGHIWHALAAAHLSAGDADAAIAAEAEAVRRRPEDAEFLRALSDAHRIRSDRELTRAIDRARDLVRVRPADPGHLIHLASLLSRRQDYAEAVDLAATVIGLGPADPQVWREASEIFSRVESWDSAIAAVRGALVRDESNAEFHGHLGRMLRRAGEFDQAIDAIDDALRRTPDDPILVALRQNVVAQRTARKQAIDRDNDALSQPTTGWSSPPNAADVLMAYRLLLGREPESDETVREHVARHTGRLELLRAFLSSGEFGRASMAADGMTAVDLDQRAAALAAPFAAPDSAEPPPVEFWMDAVGVRTRCAYRFEWRDRGGMVVRGFDGASLEWIVLLEAVAAASDRLCVVELGAGYGPWLTRGGVLWRRKYPDRPLLLVGVEGEPAHFGWLQQHTADNDLPAECLKLVAGAVGDHDGLAEFEVAARPASEWHTRVAAVAAPAGLPRVAGARRMFVPMRSLEALTAGVDCIDLLHVDIQGSEGEVIASSQAVLGSKVRRLFVATHGRGVEESLLGILPALGFELAAEVPCRFGMDGRRAGLVRDGGQYWINGGLR